MWSVGGVTLEIFLVMSDAWGQLLSRLTCPDTRVLDIGCGCGRAARVLLPSPRVKHYLGFDVIPQNIAWCNQHIKPLFFERAEFVHYDLYSAEYNPSGKMRASDLVFPCGAGTIDLVIGASLFTHLLEPDAVHYLNEINRALSRSGRAALSIHTDVGAGAQFSGTEARIDIDPQYFNQLAEKAHLTPLEVVPDVGGQRVVILRKA